MQTNILSGGKRQFVLARQAVQADGWQSEQLSNGYVLSWHKELKVSINKEKNVCLLGHAWSVTSDDRVVIEDMGRDSLLEAEKGWSGRYLLIIGDEIYLDTSGLLGVFYDEEAVTSSMNVMFQLKGREVKYPAIKHEIAPDFVPGYYTECEGVRRLVPSQVLNYVTGQVKRRALLPDRDFPNLTKEERTAKLSQCLITCMRNMQREFEGHKLCLALTGGRDSRTTLAGLLRSGVDFSTFTFYVRGIGEGDRVVPRMLAERLGLEYKYYEKCPYSKEHERAYVAFDAGMAVGGDLQHYSYRHFDQLAEGRKPIVVIKSSVYGNVILFWRHLVPFGTPFTAEALRRVFPNLACNAHHYASLKRWFDDALQDEQNIWMDIANLYHYEQRSGCWLSSIMQSLDILDGIEVVQPANCRTIISLLMGYDADERYKKEHEEYVVATMCPEIKDVPYDSDIDKSSSHISLRIKLRLRLASWLLLTYRSKAALKCSFRRVPRKW